MYSSVYQINDPKVSRQMNELQQQLFDDFPTVFQREGDTPEVGNGWVKELLRPLCQRLVGLGIADDFHVDQIKEKFGGLRFYASGASREQDDAIDAAERDSYKVCELCGSRRDVTTRGSWLLTRCLECNTKKNR